MALNALMPYMTGIIDGLAIPGSAVALKAYYDPPISKTLDGPIAYLIPGPSPGKRQTAPRGGGFKEIEWWVDIYLKFLANPNTSGVASQFSVIVDAVLYAYWTAVSPQFITDAVTNRTTQILALAEDFELVPQPVETPSTFRSLLFDSLLRIQVKEVLQA